MIFDGRATGLGSALPSSLMPLISNNWNQLFTWQGVGGMPAAEREKLRAYVATAPMNRVRGSGSGRPQICRARPREAVWSELADTGVDHINTDDLAALQQFLATRG